MKGIQLPFPRFQCRLRHCQKCPTVTGHFDENHFGENHSSEKTFWRIGVIDEIKNLHVYRPYIYIYICHIAHPKLNGDPSISYYITVILLLLIVTFSQVGGYRVSI